MFDDSFNDDRDDGPDDDNVPFCVRLDQYLADRADVLEYADNTMGHTQFEVAAHIPGRSSERAGVVMAYAIAVRKNGWLHFLGADEYGEVCDVAAFWPSAWDHVLYQRRTFEQATNHVVKDQSSVVLDNNYVRTKRKFELVHYTDLSWNEYEPL